MVTHFCQRRACSWWPGVHSWWQDWARASCLSCETRWATTYGILASLVSLIANHLTSLMKALLSNRGSLVRISRPLESDSRGSSSSDSLPVISGVMVPPSENGSSMQTMSAGRDDVRITNHQCLYYSQWPALLRQLISSGFVASLERKALEYWQGPDSLSCCCHGHLERQSAWAQGVGEETIAWDEPGVRTAFSK